MICVGTGSGTGAKKHADSSENMLAQKSLFKYSETMVEGCAARIRLRGCERDQRPVWKLEFAQPGFAFRFAEDRLMRVHRLWISWCIAACLAANGGHFSFGAVTYLDASVNNTVGAASGIVDWNDGSDITMTNGTALNDGKWRWRGDQGSLGVWEATGSNAQVEDAVELKTTIPSLANGLYDVYVFYDSSTGGDWPIRAGFTSNPGMNQIYDRSGATPGSIAGFDPFSGPFALTFEVTPPNAGAGQTMRYANLGQFNVSDGNLAVFIDDLPATTSGNRTWYEGVGYQLANTGPPIITSVMSGLASSATTWSNNQPPSSTNKYEIVSGHTVTVDAPFSGLELKATSGTTVGFSASGVFVPLLIVEAGANLTESVSGDFALGDIAQLTLGTLQLNQDVGFSIDPASDFFLDMALLGQGNLDFDSGAGSQLWLSATHGHTGTIRFNGTGDQVNITEHNQGVGTLEMNSTGANRLVYNPLDQADGGTVIFNQPGTIVHASITASPTRRLHGPNILVVNAAVTIDLTTGYPTTESPTEERRLLVTDGLQGSADITVNGTPTDLSTGNVTLNEFEIGGTGEPTGTVVTDTYSGTITGNDFVNFEIRHNLPSAGLVMNNHARLEMGHQAIPNAKNITLGEVTINSGGTLDVGFEQGLATPVGEYTSGHHAYDLILTDSGGRSGGLTLNDGATLRVQVNGTGGDQFDSITAAGDVMLNGKLNVLLNPPGTTGSSGSAANPVYSPVVGDTFDIIQVAAGSSPVGDYDGSGTVDGGDHDFWRMHFGSNNAAADGNLNGIVDAADYVVWRKNFGAMGGPGGTITGTFDSVEVTNAIAGFGFEVLYSPTLVQLRVIAAGVGAVGAVPEPATLVLAAMMLPLFIRWRDRRSQS